MYPETAEAPSNGSVANGLQAQAAAQRAGGKPGPRGPRGPAEPMTVSAAVGRIHGVLRQFSDPQDRIAALGVAMADAKKLAQKAATDKAPQAPAA